MQSDLILPIIPVRPVCTCHRNCLSPLVFPGSLPNIPFFSSTNPFEIVIKALSTAFYPMRYNYNDACTKRTDLFRHVTPSALDNHAEAVPSFKQRLGNSKQSIKIFHDFEHPCLIPLSLSLTQGEEFHFRCICMRNDCSQNSEGIHLHRYNACQHPHPPGWVHFPKRDRIDSDCKIDGGRGTDSE